MASLTTPSSLVERIEQYRAGTFRIDILRRNGKGWRKVDEVEIDPEVTHDTAEVIELVYECAKLHAEFSLEGGSYRALIRRKVRHEKEKRAATFTVETWYERRSRERAKRAEHRRRRCRRVLDIDEAWTIFHETVADFNEQCFDHAEQMRRIHTRNLALLVAQIEPFLAMYKEGLRMMDEAARARAEAQVLQLVLDRVGVQMPGEPADESSNEIRSGVPDPEPVLH
ncbi:MAG: hypothetical protein KDK70_21775 [Myxococcales bacterium]|nr:hypothetical protein [Myxococcales bacterium]